MTKNTPPPSELAIRIVCLLLCATSGLALEGKVYGVGEMQTLVLLGCLPAMVALLVLVVTLRNRFPQLGTDLLIGAVGGLLGAVAYDVVRIPAHVTGYRVYGTISVFGLWLLDAEKSSRFTELAGWSFNYLNGISFGMMYALFMRGRHWLWAVAWAFVLETLAVVTPFGRIFGLRGNVTLLVIAFAAHIAYGVPLGWAVQRWHDTRQSLQEMPPVVRYLVAVISILVLTHSLLSPDAAATDRRAKTGEFQVEGISFNPGWLRLKKAGNVIISNPQNAAVAVVLKDLRQTVTVPAGASVSSPPLAPGIHQFFVDNPVRTHSSFVVVEPVERSK